MIEVDPRIASLIEVVDVQGAGYELREVQWMDPVQAAGTHHIFVDVRKKDGTRAVGTKVTVTWANGYSTGQVEEKPGEPWGFNFAMYATFGAYSCYLGDLGQPVTTSDSVHKMGMGTPEEPDVKHHTSFGLIFVEAGGPVADEPPEAVGIYPSVATVGKVVPFDGSNSRPGTSPIASWIWSFSDGTKAYGETVGHVFSDIGAYQVSLKVTDQNGLSSETSEGTIVIEPETPGPEPEPEWPEEWKELFSKLEHIKALLLQILEKM